MATLLRNSIVLAGLDPNVLVAADVAGDDFDNNVGENIVTFLEVNNAGGAPITVTIASVDSCDQGFTHDTGGSVPNGERRLFLINPKARFNDGSNMVNITYSAVASVTVGIFSGSPS